MALLSWWPFHLHESARVRGHPKGRPAVETFPSHFRGRLYLRKSASICGSFCLTFAALREIFDFLRYSLL